MKFIFAFLLAMPVCGFAVTRSISINAPSQVTAGQSFLVPTYASTDASDGEQIGFYHAEYSTNGGASWTGFCYDVNVGGSAGRNAWITAGGAGSTILVRVKIAFRGGNAGDVDYNGGGIDWGGSWDNWQTPPTQYASISVVPPPNQAPQVNWIQNPASVPISTWFTIQARGDDPDGNLSSVWVWKEWVPFAVNGGGNGFVSYSDPNMAVGSTAGAINFQAQSFDGSGANSATIFHTVSIYNRLPRVITTVSPSTISYGQSFTATSVATDADGNLAFHGLLLLNQTQTDWLRGSMTDHSTGWGNHPVGACIVAANYTSGVVSGSSSTRTITVTPTWLGGHMVHSNAHDGTSWASNDANNWNNLCVGYASVTVGKATPNGTFASRTFTPASATYSVTSADLNAVFTNPYSNLVTAPTGSVTYTIVGSGASVTAGTALTTGVTYTVRATYAGDAYYNATTVDATWTISNANYDSDGDGLSNQLESQLGTNPNGSSTNSADTANSAALKIHKPQ